MTDLPACTHPTIETYTGPDGKPVMWGCSNPDCRRRFYPACEICVTVGHRGVEHTDEPPEPRSLDTRNWTSDPAGKVVVGQLWADNDPRYVKSNTAQKLRVIDFTTSNRGEAQAVLRNEETKKITKVLIRRMRPNSSGYVLVEDIAK